MSNDNSMNIYAAKGYKVIVTKKSAGNGYNSDSEHVAEKLEIDKIYLVESTHVSQSSTSVYIQGFDCPFNSVNFEEVEVQSNEVTDKHKDLQRFRYI